MNKWLGRILCRLGMHSWYDGYCDDGNGNSGDYISCRRCGRTEEPL